MPRSAVGLCCALLCFWCCVCLFVLFVFFLCLSLFCFSLDSPCVGLAFHAGALEYLRFFRGMLSSEVSAEGRVLRWRDKSRFSARPPGWRLVGLHRDNISI
jgi:hypothetical protein